MFSFLKEIVNSEDWENFCILKGPCKRTQQVTTSLRVVGGFWPTMLRPFALALKALRPNKKICVFPVADLPEV